MSKMFVAALLSILCLVVLPASAQIDGDGLIPDSELEFYLLQAFDADTAAQRIALNHIGIQVALINNAYIVSAALEGYPAHLAGIQRGDQIVSVDGQPFHPINSFNSRASNSSQFSPAANSYEIIFSRRGNAETVQLSPVYENLYDSYRSATIESVQVFSSGNKTIGYLRLWGLSRTTADLFTLEKIVGLFEHCDGLIIDLRNSYGYLSSKHLELFVANGRAYFSSSSPTNSHSNIAHGFAALNGRPYRRPLAVMINSETRGGAELFAYGLAKIERVITLGEITAGEIGYYSDDSGTLTEGDGRTLRYIPADKLRIDGLEFEDVGVIPEESVPYPFEQSSRSDPQFETAVALLLDII